MKSIQDASVASSCTPLDNSRLVGSRYAALGEVMVGGRPGVIEMGAVSELEEVAVVTVLVNVPELEAVGPGCRAVALARRAASSVDLRPPVGMPRSRHS